MKLGTYMLLYVKQLYNCTIFRIFLIFFEYPLDIKNEVKEYKIVNYFMLNSNNIGQGRKIQTENIGYVLLVRLTQPMC